MVEAKKIHFIGIGGIGVSGLASICLEQGCEVSGSDLKESEVTKALQKKGAKIFIGHDARKMGKPDLIVYSVAVPKQNPELQKAKKLKIKTQTYAQALGEFSKNYFFIAIAGTHGKSTTASMIAQILIKAGLDPSFIIGTKPGFRVGKSKYLVIEADEYKDSFLNYYPDISVITNIETDHLDYFKDLAHIKRSFAQFKKQSKKIIFWKQEKIKLQVPGIHNQKNASAALAITRELKIKDSVSKKALFEYQGIWRRFDIGKKIKGAIIIHDYAHHPTEVKATLQAAQERYPNKKIIAVFQVHHQNRLNRFFQDFTKAFKNADQIIITNIYKVPGRHEQEKYTVQDLAKKLNAEFVKLNKLPEFIKKIAAPNKIILLLGAGDIYDICLD